jgi:RecG-like helicase
MQKTPTDEQARAIKAISDWYRHSAQQEFLLDGEWGTGKSTVAAFAKQELLTGRKRA